MSTRRYQLLENLVVLSQLEERLKGYIPTTDKAAIVSGLKATEQGLEMTMGDGYVSTIPIAPSSQAKAFEEVILDDTGFLHFYDANRNDVYDPIYFGNVGGGSSSLTYMLSFTNLMESRMLSIAEGDSVIIHTEYSSVDKDGYDDGPGVGTIYVGGVKKATINIKQGENFIDVTKLLSTGTNSVKINVENTDGSSKSIVYTVNVISLTISTTLSQFIRCTGDTIFYYRPVGSGVKTIYFKMDGKELATETVESSGRSLTYTIPAQAHGGHVFECYATTEVDGVFVQSEPIVLGMIWVDAANANPSIVMLPSTDSATQGEALTFPYMVYDPMTESPTVTYTIYKEDGSVYSTQNYTVDSTAQAWVTQDYPAGNVRFRVSIGNEYSEATIAVAESEIIIATVEDSLMLDFDPRGRSNFEDNPAVWTNGNISATFSEIGFAGSDGWMTDASGSTMLRILPGGEMTIPYTFFASDKRDVGATIEVEMATHNVRDYDSVVVSCLSGGRGIKIASQYAQLNSEQSEISMQFVEDKRVRVSFVVESKNLNRLIYVYVNGIMCGAIQYPEDDNFAQNPAVGITIGAESSGIDVYRILMYNKGLIATEVTGNFVADRPTLAERLSAHQRNDILDSSENISIPKLPATLPYMIISCAELPQFKGDKKTCDVEYINVGDSARSFEADISEIDVQGTSSAGYKKKNWKIKFKNGVTYTANNALADGYSIRANSIPVSAVCMKADVASSEGANNVELVRLYNDICPYKTEAQEADPRVRVGIDGVPCIVFWHNTNTGEIKFWGKYNLNNEKSNHEVYGLTDGCESWEICNNTSNRVIFKESDFEHLDWMSDFEARYPEDSLDYTNLKRMTDWVVSTDRSAVSTEAEKQARLEKFKMEFEDYFVKDAMIFYYVFTETFLMVDNRAKNFFPTTYDGIHWMPLPYDMDTAIGINNEGQLVFDYDLEDTDMVNGADVFNGQHSVLWCNIRDGFPEDVKAMYAKLRGATGTLFAYDPIIQRFDEHQSVWPETVWNEDAYEKNLEPLINDKDGSYLAMLQGDKSSQREWWLFNAFRYRDSKYQCGDANNYYITLRCYATGDITVTPYSHIWPRIKYGSYTVTERGKRNVATTIACPLDAMNDTEVYIYSADRLADIGDLSGLKVGYANFTAATKLQKLKLGDSASGYQNTNLTEVYVGNNELLTELDVRNCVNLKQAVDVSGCSGIERVYAGGSSVSAITLPVGGKIKHLELPNTVANLTLRNCKQFQTLDMAGCDSLTTLRIENTPNIPFENIVINSPKLERVRLVGLEWTPASEESLRTMLEKLATCGGLDSTAGNLDKAVVSGKVNVTSISSDLLEYIYETFPDLVVSVNGSVSYVVRYIDGDGAVLYKYIVPEGGNAIDPTPHISKTPSKTGNEDVAYVFSSWGTLPTDIHSNTNVYAQFTSKWPVRFYDGNDTLLYTLWVMNGEDAVDPIEAGYITENPVKDGGEDVGYAYAGWESIPTNVTSGMSVHAKFTEAWAVRFYVDGEVKNTQYVVNGNDAVDPVTSGLIDAPTKEGNDDMGYAFNGWDKAFTNIAGPTVINALFVEAWAVRFYVEGVLKNTQFIVNGEDAVDPVTAGLMSTPDKPDTAQYDYTYAGWDSTFTNITAAKNINAVFTSVTRTYKVYFYNEDVLLQTAEVPYGGSATYVGDTPVNNSTGNPEDFKFTGWSPEPKNIQKDTYCYAVFEDNRVIADDWSTIITKATNGTAASSYGVGSFKSLDIGGADLPYAFINGHSVLYDNEIHILGGGTANSFTAHCKWNGTEWVSVSTLPHAFYNGYVVVYNDEIHILGGGGSNTSHYKWNGSEWVSASTLPYNFYAGSAVVYNNEVHLLGGSGNNMAHYKWNGTEWVSVSTLPYEFHQGSAVVYNNEIHILGSNYGSATYKSHYKWNGSEWTSVSTLPYKFNQGSAVVYNSEIHIMGGSGGNTNHYKWNGTEWTSASTLPCNFKSKTAVLYNDELYILGDDTLRTAFYAYSFETNEWHKPGATTIPMQVVAHEHDDLAGGKWESMGTLPYKFYRGSTVEYNNETHIIGGYGNKTAHYKWNGTEWASVSTLPYNFDIGGAVVYNNEIHILGSMDSPTSHYKWNGTEWTSVSTLPYKFYGGYAVVYNNEIHILGSNYGSATYKSHYKWNGSEWTSVSTLPYKFNQGSAVVYNSEIHILCGMYSATSHYKWNGTEWTSVSTLPCNYPNGSAVVYNNEIHIMLGVSGKSYHNKWNGTEWVEVSTLPYDFYTGSAIVYNNEICIIGGQNNETKFYSYAVASVEWESLETLPYYFDNGSAVVCNNEVHILGGSSNKTGHYKWNGTSWASVSTLPYNLYNGSAVVYNNETHIIGGYGNQTAHYKWNGTEWVSASTLPYNFSYSSAVVYNGEIHILGGYKCEQNHYKWNGSEWTSVSTLPYELEDGCAVVYNDEIHILGSSEDETKHYKWNGTSWTSVSTLPHGFYRGSAVVCNNEIHILGSYSSANYCKWNGSEWISLSALPYKFYLGSAVVYNNEIHIVGGQNNASKFYALKTTYPKSSLTFIAKVLLDEPRMFNDGNKLTGGYAASALRTWLNGEFFASLPAELQTGIKEVKKISDGGDVRELVTSNEKVWIPSLAEMGINFSNNVVINGQGTAYNVFTDNESRIRAIANGTNSTYHTRSTSGYGNSWSIKWDGRDDTTSYSDYRYLLIGFCI